VTKVLYSANPSMFRTNPVAFVVLVLLVPVLIGAIGLLWWWLDCKRTLLTIDEEKSTLRTGLLSRHTNVVFHRDVRNLRVSQTFFQRVFGVGTLSISSAGQSDVEIEVAGLPDPDEARRVIDAARARRDAPAPEAAPPSTVELLERLASLRRSGALSEAEYESEKAKLLR
jgi:uncharacterized membrane protein YdbT with pleckstrin-like domain